MYHPSLPVPSEIEDEILRKSDAKGIFSYLTSHVDAYQRALTPSFWYKYDHYTSQEVFEEAVKHRSYELIKSMMDNYQIDSVVLKRVKMKFLVDGDYEGMILFGVIDGRLKMEELSKALLDQDEEMILEYREYLDAVMPNFPIEDLYWIFNTEMPIESQLEREIAGSLLRVKRIDDFKELQLYFLDRVNAIIDERSNGRQEYDAVPFFYEILAYADWDTYNDFKAGDPDRYEYAEIYSSKDPYLISDPRLYWYFYNLKKKDYDNIETAYWKEDIINEYYNIIELGFVLKPEEWLPLIADLEVDREEIVENTANNAYFHGYEYFARSIY